MYFVSRLVLGEKLSQRLEKFRNNDSVIMCLDINSLLACIELATKLHSWIYVIHHEPVSDPYAVGRTLGVVLQNGLFVLNPEISKQEYEYIYTNFSNQIEQTKREAMTRLNQDNRASTVDIKVINGRNLLLMDDIFRDNMSLAVAKTILKPLSPAYIEGVAGNILPDANTKLYLETQGTTYMDIIPTGFFDDDHYFEQQDLYSNGQKLDLAKNISIYWA